MSKEKKSQSKLRTSQGNNNQGTNNHDMNKHDMNNHNISNQVEYQVGMTNHHTDALDQNEGDSNNKSGRLNFENSNLSQVQNMQTYRFEIDRIDQILIENIIKRFIVTDQVGMYKKIHEMTVSDSSREQAIYMKNRERVNSFFASINENNFIDLVTNLDTINDSDTLSLDDQISQLKLEIMEIIDKLYEIIIANSVMRQDKILNQ